MIEDLYELLGIQRDALEQEIRSSYRRRALQVHPDKGGSEDGQLQIPSCRTSCGCALSRISFTRS